MTSDPHSDPSRPSARVAVIGRGRLGTALTAALARAGMAVDGPLGRGADGSGADLVLLCVPDAQIAAAASAVTPGPLVGHCSGAATLEPLGEHEAFSLHPLMTVTAEGARFEGAGCAVAGSTARARETAEGLARALGMRPFEVRNDDRAAYHAAASMASNFLVTLEAAAERLAATAGASRQDLAPLVRATVDNWARLGPEDALTGPIARGDEETAGHQRRAVADRAPELLPVFDALAGATRQLAGRDGTSAGPDSPPPGGLAIVRSATELRAALAPARRDGSTIGLVPTMGAFHEGHASLIRRARAAADVVVVSLFVNPTQFGAGEDLEGYPRDEDADAARAAQLGADLLFVPPVEEMYPDGFATEVNVTGLSDTLCGAIRGPEHFRGVATVVTKLLNLVGPDSVFFGQKDAQQAAVIRRLVRDLDFPVRVEVMPTVREPDGLALSSRNAYLDPEERERAVALRRALEAAEGAVASGERDTTAVLQAAREAMVPHAVTPEYLEAVSPETLLPVASIDGDTLVAVAARIGRARLIDNTLIHVNGGPQS